MLGFLRLKKCNVHVPLSVEICFKVFCDEHLISLLTVICLWSHKIPPSLDLTMNTEDFFTNSLEKMIYIVLRAAGKTHLIGLQKVRAVNKT